MRRRDLDRVYWSLVIFGPMTFHDLQAWTNWTRHRLNQALENLKHTGCVELIERNQHRSPRWNAQPCGKWRACLDSPRLELEA
jgi:hypothetical protein